MSYFLVSLCLAVLVGALRQWSLASRPGGSAVHSRAVRAGRAPRARRRVEVDRAA